jgi:hypothetical protein
MTKLTGIRSLFEGMLYPSWDFSGLIPSIKQQCLFFDSIGFLDLDDHLSPFSIQLTKQQQSDIEWLKENGIIYGISYPEDIAPKEDRSRFMKYLSDIGMGDDYWEYFLPMIDQSYKSFSIFSKKSRKLRLQTDKEITALKGKFSEDSLDYALNFTKVIELFRQDSTKLIKYLGASQIKKESIIARFISIKMMYFEKTDSLSLIPYYEFPNIPSSRKSEVAKITITKLPIPDENTSWEQILDFRNDPNNQSALLNLRRWMRKVSSENLSSVEIEEELEWLLDEYQRNIKLHKIKSDTNMMEVLIKSPLELLENLVTLKFSKLSDPLFAIKKRKISLLEAELHAPGREVAYILKAQDQFS